MRVAAAIDPGTRGHCPYCALQCAMSLAPSDEPASRLPLTVTGRQFPTNRGGLCQKGWTSAQVLRTPDRLTTPLVRGADGELHPTGWDEALDLVAGRITALQAAQGRGSIAVFGGALKDIGEADISTGQEIVATLFGLAIMLSVYYVPVLIYMIDRKRAEPMLARMTDWIMGNLRMIKIVVGLAFGIYFLAKGLAVLL